MSAVRAAGSEQDGCLFLTAAFAGLRMGELLALQWRDLDYAGDAIRVAARDAPTEHGCEASFPRPTETLGFGPAVLVAGSNGSLRGS